MADSQDSSSSSKRSGPRNDSKDASSKSSTRQFNPYYMLASARPRSIHYSSWVEEMYHLETDTPEDIQARITRMAAEQEAAAKLSKTNEASVLEVAKKKASNRWKAIAFHVKAFAVLIKMAKMFQPKPSRRQ